jgi:hypothetical protein
MAGRPLRLVYTPPTWATAGSFPAGANPWNAQPMRVAPATGYFLPNTVPPAEYENYLHGAALDGLATIETAFLAEFDFVSPIQAINWPALVTRTGGPGTERIMSAFWDAFNSRWIMLSGLTGGTTPKYINASIDGGLSYTLLSTQSPTGGGYLLAGCADPGSNKSIICPSASTFFYVSTNGTSWAVSTVGGASYTYTSALFFAGLFVAIGCESGAAVAHVTTSPDTTTWTDRTAAIPAALATLAGSATSWVSATNGSIIVAVPQQNAGFASGATMTSTNGTTWTLGSFASGSILNADIVSGLAYSATDGLFIMTLQSAGTVTKILTSPNGTTWTYLRSVSGRFLTALAAIGSVWVAYSLKSGVAAEVLFSLNAGLTWAVAPLTMPTDANPPGGGIVAPGVAGSGTQFLIWNAVAAYASLKAGALPTF